MADLISRDTALKIYTDWTIDPEEAIVKLRAIPAIDPSAIREAALREAERIAEYHAGRNCTASDVLLDIRRALIGEKK
jgi:hypothetical protein